MSKKFQLQIPEPCHESWDKMTPVDKGRFCSSCQKAVVDFTGMSDSQLIVFFKKASIGSVCGRFYHDQLERDFETPRKRIPWVKYFLQLIVPAFLFTLKARSQGQPRITGDTVLVDSKKIGKNTNERCYKPDTNKSDKVTGKLIDNKGAGIPYATVMIKGTRSGVAADANGNFSIGPFADKSPATLVFSCVGFETKELIIDTNKIVSRCNVDLTPMLSGTLGGLVVVGRTVKRKKELLKLYQRIFKDTSYKFFKAYPNPVSGGSILKIELNKAGAGEYQADLINQNGQIVHSASLVFETANQLITLNVPMTTTGTYFLRMTNKKSGENHTEKMIIQ